MSSSNQTPKDSQKSDNTPHQDSSNPQTVEQRIHDLAHDFIDDMIEKQQPSATKPGPQGGNGNDNAKDRGGREGLEKKDGDAGVL